MSYGISYTYEERQAICRMFDGGRTPAEIARVISAIPFRPHRSESAIVTQLSLMGKTAKLDRGRKLTRDREWQGRQDGIFLNEISDRAPAKPPGQSYVSSIPAPSVARLMAGK